ncbi:hypothetical protein BKA62DRAFT_773428 [Auriculariales sp. MPI-PUGE-AT-0066]|nr:hypothetical protein BKA62DRAFT_773428 [Auriculariales sp. MPI-PUGE-AT-0066]
MSKLTPVIPKIDKDAYVVPPAPSGFSPKGKDAQKGNDGKAGGVLNLLVRTSVDPLLASNKLVLESNGGAGSGGQRTTDAAFDDHSNDPNDRYPRGGAGGSGGHAGTINIYYHGQESVLVSKLEPIVKDEQLSWGSKMEALMPFLDMLTAVDLSLVSNAASVLADYAKAVNSYVDFFHAVSAAARATQHITSFTPSTMYPNAEPPSVNLIGSAGMLGAFFSQALLSSKPPDFVLAAMSIALKDTGEAVLLSKLQEVFALQMNAPAHASDGIRFRPAQDALDVLLASSAAAKDAKINASCSIKYGNGAPGGNNTNWDDMDRGSGTIDGKNGKEGALSATHFHFTNGAALQACTLAYAFPEQCQMLLDKAEPDDVAAQAYADLLRRLAFFPLLKKETMTTPVSVDKSAIWTAYIDLEHSKRLTVGAIDVLQSVYQTAELRINAISLGCDMFGNAANWVPWLSPTWRRRDRPGCEIDEGISASKDAATSATSEIAELCSNTSSLATYRSKSNWLTYSLYNLRNEVTKAMEVVQKDIDEHWSIQAGDVYNGICSLVQSSRDPFTVVKTLGDYAYNAKTTIADDDGNSVKKAYLVKKLVAFEGNVKKLDLVYKGAVADGTPADEPGSVKILATKESIEELMSQYTESIPQQHRDDLSGRLRQLLDVALERNDAVIKYNAGLQQYSQKISLNPGVPALYYALNKVRRSMQLDTLRNLSFEGRAQAFWAVKRINQIPSTSPSELKGSSDLTEYQRTLNTSFTACLNDWANYTWGTWPGKDDNSQVGVIYELSPAELKVLLTPLTGPESPAGQRLFRTTVTLHPDMESFGGGANVRLRQVRVWIPRAKRRPDVLGRQLLTIRIRHGGLETLQLKKGEGIQYLHDQVGFPWRYDATRVNKKEDIQNVKARAAGQKTKAAIGPFTAWTVEIDEADNPDLDLGDVETAYMEFWGREVLSQHK